VTINGYPTEEEFDLINEATLLPVLTQVLDHNMKAIMNSDLKFKEIHFQHLQLVLDKVIKILGNVKKELRKRNIKIYDEERDDKGMVYKYISRGYHGTSKILWPSVKAYTEEKLKSYMLR
jgi:hypothetical protein